MQRTLVVLIFSGVLERFPNLKFVSAENEVGWLPFFLQKLDQAQEEYRYLYPAPLKLKPSEYLRRQIFATFINDPVGVAVREFIGVENIMWSSDYPHTVSTWPHSREVVERDFKGVPESEKRQIVCENGEPGNVDGLAQNVKRVIIARTPRNCFEERYARLLVSCLEGDCGAGSAGVAIGGECTFGK